MHIGKRKIKTFTSTKDKAKNTPTIIHLNVMNDVAIYYVKRKEESLQSDKGGENAGRNFKDFIIMKRVLHNVMVRLKD